MTIHHSSNGTHYYILAENNHFLHSDLIIRSTTAPFETGRYHYIKDAQGAIDAYASSNQPRAKVYKLLEPRVSIHNPDKWIVSTEDKLAFLRIDGTVVYGLRFTDTTGYFPTYTSALFHKLRYERLNKGT